MDDNQKLALWKVKWQSDYRRRQTKIVAVIGVMLSLVALSMQPNTFWIVTVAMAAAGIASNPTIVEDCKSPEPKLELINEKYKVKASGVDGITALALVVAF